MLETSRKVALCILCLALSLLVSQVWCQSTANNSDTTTATPDLPTSTSNSTSTVAATSQNSPTSAPPVTSTEAASLSASTVSTGNTLNATSTNASSTPAAGTTGSGSTATGTDRNQTTAATPVTSTGAASPSASTVSSGNATSTNTSSTPGAGTTGSGSTATGTDGNQTTAASTSTSAGQNNATVSTTTEQQTGDAATSSPGSIASTTAPSTTPTTTTTPTTSLPPNSLPFSSDTFKFTIMFGENKTVSCTTCNFTTVKDPVYNAFKSITGFLYVPPMAQASGALDFQVDMWFSASQLLTVDKTQWGAQIHQAILNLNNTDGLSVKTESANATAQAFVGNISSVCLSPNICPLGYDCKLEGFCQHKCTSVSCGDHGDCSVTISIQGVASTSCVCQSNYDYTYSGDKCQDSETSKGKVAAIVGGVLGAFCGLFLIIIIIMCCRQRGDSSGSKYNLSGNANRGYSDMGMKEL